MGLEAGAGFVDVRAGVRGQETPGSAGQRELGWHKSMGVVTGGVSFKSGSFLCSSVLTWFLFLPIPRTQGSVTCALFWRLSTPESFHITPSSPRNDCCAWGMGLQHPG